MKLQIHKLAESGALAIALPVVDLIHGSGLASWLSLPLLMGGDFLLLAAELSLPWWIAILGLVLSGLGIYQVWNAEKNRRIRAEEERDIFAEQLTDLARRHAELQVNAELDLATGTLNRNQVRRVVEQRIMQARQAGTGFCVLLADVDDFKSVNERFHHEKGNLVLKMVAELLRSRQGQDKLIRYGGDEFLIVTGVGNDLASGHALAERLRRRVEAHAFDLQDDVAALRITLSCGVACFDPEADDMDSLLERVALALKSAKANQSRGQNKNFVFALPLGG